MIRVLRVISRMNVGGPARSVLLLCSGLAGRGFETVVAAGRPGTGEGDLAERVAAAGGRFVRVPGMRREVAPCGDVRALLFLRSLMASFRPHIVHTHASKAGLLGRVAALGSRHRAGIVHTFHGHVLDSYFGPAFSAALRRIERALAARSHVLVAVADSVRRELLERHRVGRLEQYRVIPSGGQAGLAAPAGAAGRGLKEELGLGPGPVAVLVGRMAAVKGHDLLFEALPLLLRRVSDLTVLLAGDGPLRADLERRAAASPAGRAVRFLGNREDVARVLQAADLLLLPSRKEGLPTVLLEAAEMGVPVAAARIPGVTDVVEDGISALLFEPGDAAGLAGAAARLCGDAELCALLARNARAAAARVMAPAAVVSAHVELYKKLCDDLRLDV